MNANEIIALKIRPLIQSTSGHYDQGYINHSTYFELFDKWINAGVSNNIVKAQFFTGTFIELKDDKHKNIPEQEFKIFLLLHDDGPLISFNSSNANHLSKLLVPVGEHIYEIIQILKAHNNVPFDAFNIEVSTMDKTKSLGMLSSADLKQNPQWKIRALINSQPSFNHHPYPEYGPLSIAPPTLSRRWTPVLNPPSPAECFELYERLFKLTSQIKYHSTHIIEKINFHNKDTTLVNSIKIIASGLGTKANFTHSPASDTNQILESFS
ncbi:MAG: hypothetical protein ABI855_18995, partial [Bacteroidota bacterium]